MPTTTNRTFLKQYASALLRLVAIVFPCVVSHTVSAQVNAQRGATVGGIAGAVAGAAIGDHNGETGAGAAIGGIIGAFAGGLLGNAEDEQRAYQRQRQYQQNQRIQFQYQKFAVSSADVIAMTRNGLSEQLIINQIQQRGVQTRPKVAEIIALHQQGVSENVISAMQQAQDRPSQPSRAAFTMQQSPTPQRGYVPIIAPVPSYHLIPSCPLPRYYYPERFHHYHHGYNSGIHIRF